MNRTPPSSSGSRRAGHRTHTTSRRQAEPWGPDHWLGLCISILIVAVIGLAVWGLSRLPAIDVAFILFVGPLFIGAVAAASR